MAHPFRIYSTLERKVVDFEPLEEGKVGLYVCGVTVYDDIHVGHGRCFVVFDAFVRYLRARGWDVNVLCERFRGAPERESIDGVRVHRLRRVPARHLAPCLRPRRAAVSRCSTQDSAAGDPGVPRAAPPDAVLPPGRSLHPGLA